MADESVPTAPHPPASTKLFFWRQIILFRIGPLLDELVFVFLIAVLLTGHTAWWITLPGPYWLHDPVVFTWVSFAFIYWFAGRMVRFHGELGKQINFRAAIGLWRSSRRLAACLLAVISTAELLTWLLLAMLAADTIRYYQLWTATHGDVSCWVPMCLLVALLLGTWMWSVRYRRPDIASLSPSHRHYQYHKSWPMVAVGLAAMAICGYLVAEFPNPPKHRVGLAVVLGNHVLANDTPGCVLRGRLRAAIWLYQHGMVKYIMVSGRANFGRDNPKHNEPVAMTAYCLEHHIPYRALVVDYYGDNTRYTVYHAVEWMHAHHIRHVVGISSIYHLPRIYIAFRQLGVTAYTMASIKHAWREINPWGLLRECIAVPVYGLDPHYHQPAGGLNGHWINKH